MSAASRLFLAFYYLVMNREVQHKPKKGKTEDVSDILYIKWFPDARERRLSVFVHALDMYCTMFDISNNRLQLHQIETGSA